MARLGGAFDGLNIIAVHTVRPPWYRVQNQQFEELVSLIHGVEGHKVVMGDFNATPVLAAGSPICGVERPQPHHLATVMAGVLRIAAARHRPHLPVAWPARSEGADDRRKRRFGPLSRRATVGCRTRASRSNPGSDAESFQVDEDPGLEQVLCRHGRRAAGIVGARANRRCHERATRCAGSSSGRAADPAPAMSGRAPRRPGAGRRRLGRRPAAAPARHRAERRPRTYCRIERRLATRKGEIGAPDRFQRCHRIGLAVIEGSLQCGGKALEAALGDVGEEGVTVAEMAIGRSRAHSRRPRRLGKGEAGGTLGGDEVEGPPGSDLPSDCRDDTLGGGSRCHVSTSP